jgi:hypothetical protein
VITIDVGVTIATSVAQLSAIAASLNIVAGGLAIVVVVIRLVDVLKARRRRHRKP